MLLVFDKYRDLKAASDHGCQLLAGWLSELPAPEVLEVMRWLKPPKKRGRPATTKKEIEAAIASLGASGSGPFSVKSLADEMSRSGNNAVGAPSKARALRRDRGRQKIK
jgi:hypothetical protein